jgi:hypothetical protein
MCFVRVVTTGQWARQPYLSAAIGEQSSAAIGVSKAFRIR